MNFKNLLLLLSISFFVSCGTSSVYVKIQRPADISVPQTVKKVVEFKLRH